MDLYIYLIIYIALLFLLVFWVRKKENSEDFLISGRNRSTLQIGLSKFAGTVGVGFFVAYTGYAYKFGLGIFAILAGLLIGYVFFLYWGIPRFYLKSRENRFYTQGDYVEHATGSRLSRGISDIMSIAIQFSWLMVNLIGGGKIISHLGLLSYEGAVIITGLVIATYIFLAGFRAVILTDVFQSIIIICLLVFLSLFIIKDTNVLGLFSLETSHISFADLVGFLFYGALSFFALADRYQLIYAAKDEKTAKNGLFLAIAPIALVSVFILIVGLFIFSQNPNLDPDIVFLKAISDFLPASLIPVALVMFFGGLMSSADTHVYAVSSQYSFFRRKDNSIEHIRKVTIFVVLLATLLALVFNNIIDTAILGAILTMSLAIPMIYIVYGGRESKIFITTSIFSFVGVLIGVSLFGIVPATTLAPVLTGCIGLLFAKVCLQRVNSI
jgi:Na+/proline symporter